MALHYAGIQCELREILLRDKPATMLAISPKATVPVLQLTDGRVIDESLDIMSWALPENDAYLQADADEMSDLIAFNDGVFKQHLDRYKYQQGLEPDEVQAVVDAGCLFLNRLDQRLAQSKFLVSDAASLADIALFPFVRQFAAVDRGAFEALPFVHLQRWLSGWLDDRRFKAIMLKRQPWHAGDDAVFLL